MYDFQFFYIIRYNMLSLDLLHDNLKSINHQSKHSQVATNSPHIFKAEEFTHDIQGRVYNIHLHVYVGTISTHLICRYHLHQIGVAIYIQIMLELICHLIGTSQSYVQGAKYVYKPGQALQVIRWSGARYLGLQPTQVDVHEEWRVEINKAIHCRACDSSHQIPQWKYQIVVKAFVSAIP